MRGSSEADAITMLETIREYAVERLLEVASNPLRGGRMRLQFVLGEEGNRS